MFSLVHQALHTLGNGVKELTGVESSTKEDAH